MPNHVTSRLEFDCSIEEMENIFNTFNNHVKAKLYRAYNDRIICKEKDGKGGIGWYDKKTGMFSQREKEDILGLPENFEFEINQPFDHFPDFNKIIPQPENIFNGDLGQKEIDMCKKEGRPNWSDWNREFWGTKWNSYSCNKVKWNTFEFDTAWSSVPNLIIEMSKKFPDVEIIYTYADEDTGYNTGLLKIKNGEVLESEIPAGGSSRGYEIYLSINPDCEYIKLIDGNYEYVDEEDDE